MQNVLLNESNRDSKNISKLEINNTNSQLNNNISKSTFSFSQTEKEIIHDLITRSIIDEQQLKIVAIEYKKKKQDLPAILISLGFVTNFEMKRILKEKYKVENIFLEGHSPNYSIMQGIHKSAMLSHKFVPFLLEDDTIHIATSNPVDTKTLEVIQTSIGNKFQQTKLFYASAEDITHFISSAYIIAENRLDAIVRKFQENSLFLEEGQNKKHEDSSVIDFINCLLEDATLKGASDIHIEPQHEFIRIRYRIDGKLSSVIHIQRKFWNSIVVRIKVISNMNIAESRKPQDGRIEMEIAGRSVDFRLSCQPGIYGEKFVVRILDKSKSLMTLEQLGFSEWNYKKMMYTIERPSGITIVTGPTGSGKTTTLYSMLGYLNNPDTNIMTLEDPVEYTVPLVFQTQVREDSAFDFASGVRSSMRQDPDILLIGEIRDHGTAEAAVRASLTGHKVLTTLHTVDAATTIQRLVDIGIARYMISGNLDSVIAQRLIRKLCSHCKIPHTEFLEIELEILEKYQNLMPSKPEICKPVGCVHCRNTGYRGRTTIAEILHVTPEIDNAILEEGTKHKIIAIAKEQGFRTLQEDAMHRVFEGAVALEEIRMSVNLI